MLFSPLVPAMIIISREEAKDKMESLKSMYDKEKETVKETVLEECDVLTKYINETRQEQLSICIGYLEIFKTPL